MPRDAAGPLVGSLMITKMVADGDSFKGNLYDYILRQDLHRQDAANGDKLDSPAASWVA